MPKLIRRAVVLAKIEVTSGTDPTPTGVANAILVRNMTLTPIEQALVGRELVRPWLGNDEQIVVHNHLMCEFEVEMAGSGTAGTPPAYAPLLLACAMGETDSASDDIYKPISTAMPNITLYVNIDGVLHETNYAAGDVSMVMDAGGIPVYKFSFRGLFVPVIDSAAPTPTYTAFQKPLAVNKANTTLTLHGFAAVVDKLTINLKNEYPYRNLINFEGVTVNDRKPDGSISMEMTSVASKPWMTSIAAGTTGALQVVHGTTAGNIVQIDAATVQLTQPRFSDINGILMLQATLIFIPGSSGNDEFSITVK